MNKTEILAKLAAHRATFWSATDCNAYMATEEAILAELARATGKETVARNHEETAAFYGSFVKKG